jgi:hypothetical protein
MARNVFNLKRAHAGFYTSPDGNYYVIRSATDDGKQIYWTVGQVINGQCEVLEDFAKYSHARNFLMQINLQEKASK